MMKFRYLGVASLLLASAGLSACGGSASKEDMLGICSAKQQGGAQTCSCFLAKFESDLSDSDMKTLINAVDENRVFSGDWIPERMYSHPTIGPVIKQATAACVAP